MSTKFDGFMDLSERARRVQQEFPSKSHQVCWPDPADYVMDETVPAAGPNLVYGMYHVVIMGQVAKISKQFEQMQMESYGCAETAAVVKKSAHELMMLADQMQQFGAQYREWIDAGCWNPSEDDLLAN